ncbi:predicted protein [Nematostella vectensis]|uniref:Uncharacterized protein n=1 Tax=Nematostella vectensis TaxID=45351 RepID=A7STG5_NEMVE|nr:predicted protein [Nematostella vectensis]|eukprot:XP_001625118.1 predicted protein [Nematostella vectensis]
MSAFLYSPDGKVCCISNLGYINGQEIANLTKQGTIKDFYLLHNGHLVFPSDGILLAPDDTLRIIPRLVGGKGGFGSMLRAIGAQIEKTTSREACRDLSGRRMRDVNDEKKITEWVAKQAEREREAARRKQEKMEKRRSLPNHNFDDASYTQQIQENAGKIEDALKQGLKASTSEPSTSSAGSKRTGPSKGPATKKKKVWLGMDDLEDESEEDISDEEYNRIHQDMPGTSTSTSTEETQTSAIISTENTTATEASTSHKDPHTKTTKTEDEPLAQRVDQEVGETVQSSSCIMFESLVESERSDSDRSDSTEGDTMPSKGSETAKCDQDKPFCIDEYNSATELENLGLECLKQHLMSLGLKCGGTLQERAQRLFLTKGVSLEKLDPALFAKAAKPKKKQKK